MSDEFDFAAWIAAGKKATPGPWVFIPGGAECGCCDVIHAPGETYDIHSGGIFHMDDSPFIAQSRMAPDAVIEMVREARELAHEVYMNSLSQNQIDRAARFMDLTAWAEKREDRGMSKSYERWVIFDPCEPTKLAFETAAETEDGSWLMWLGDRACDREIAKAKRRGERAVRVTVTVEEEEE